MAIFAQKTMQFVRAPDENVFIPRTYSVNSRGIQVANRIRASIQSCRDLVPSSSI
jgi:hypothetical protein